MCWYVAWQVARQLQLHCLGRLNPFIPCVCTFTYTCTLSSSIIFTADTSIATVVLAAHVQSSAIVDHAHEHVNISEYTDHFMAYMDLGNQGMTNTG